MLGIKRKRAVRQVVHDLQRVIGSIQHLHGLPAGFWTHDFVVGFVGTAAGVIFAGARLSTKDKGYALAEVFSLLSGLNGADIARHYVAAGDNESDDFRDGADNAAVVSFYMAGILKKEEQNESVVAARKLAEATALDRGDSEVDRAAVAGCLIIVLFVNEVKKRFAI